MITFALPNDELLLAAVGKIAIRHGQLDYCLKIAIKTVTGVTRNDALIANDGVSSLDLRKRLRAVVKERLGNGEVLDKLDKLLQRASNATRRRNTLLHGLWAHELDGRPVMRSKGVAFDPAPSIADLESAADALAQIATELTLARQEGFLHEAFSN